MSSANYKSTIIVAMAEILKPEGFRRNGPNFSREKSDVIHLLSMQSSMSSTANLLKATVNLGIWIPALANEGAKPNIAECHWHKRIGSLMPERTDVWWSVSSESEATLAAAEISHLIRGIGLPALNALATIASLRTLWQTGVSPGLTEIQRQRFLLKLGG